MLCRRCFNRSYARGHVYVRSSERSVFLFAENFSSLSNLPLIFFLVAGRPYDSRYPGMPVAWRRRASRPSSTMPWRVWT